MRRLSFAGKLLPHSLAAFLLAVVAVVPGYSQTGDTAAKPDRGMSSSSSYALSELENINLSNGNLTISIPLASLPAIAGGKLNFTLKATYNSKLFNTYSVESRLGPGAAGALIYSKQLPRLSNEGGWTINGRYFITSETASEDFVRLGDTGDPDLPFIGGLSKVFLVTPDGSRHELRPIDYPAWDRNNPTYLGYYTTPSNVPIRYYSFDGSYLWVRVNPAGSAILFEVYQPDGTKITQGSDGVQRITDTNGNSIKIFTDINGVTHYQDEQAPGREIKYFEDSGNVGHVEYQTVNGNWVSVDIAFGETTVRGKAYDITTFCSPDQPDCQCTYQEQFTQAMRVIREITLPVTEPAPAARQKFLFSYNSDINNPFPGMYQPSCFSEQHQIVNSSYGNGQLSEMRLPTGSIVKYSYGLEGNDVFGPTTNLASEGVTGKSLEHDGTTDFWTYFITETFARVTNPDDSVVEQDSFHHLPAHMSSMGGADGLGGLVYRVKQGGKELIERHWTRLKFSGGQDEAPGGGKTVFNPVVDFEYRSLLGPNGSAIKMSARAFTYDFNGNVLQTKEYDWFNPNLVSRDIHGIPTAIPPGATLLRTVTSSYHNESTSAGSNNVYAKRLLSATTPPILNSLRQTTVGPALTQFAYDSQAFDATPTLGNVTSQRVWDNQSGAWITSSQTYDTYGNMITRTDGRGNETKYFFEDATHALPTRVEVDPENGLGVHTASTVYDFSTGLVKQQTDPNGNISDISYTNQLTGLMDPYGRPGVTTGPIVNAGGANQRQRITFTYFDAARQTVAAADLNTEDDRLLKKRLTLDMMGREVLREQSEDGTTYTISARKAYDLKFRATYTSSPMRSAGASTDGWTRTITDELGRITSVASFAGATQPTLTATNWIGRTTTSYDGFQTTVTDAAGKARRTDVDGLSRLVKVVEDPAGVAYETTYIYDTLGNLTTVVQGGQTRTFNYDSLSRLTSSAIPESGTIQYEYDNNGNLTRKVDPRLLPNTQTHLELTYEYDALNRLTARTYNDGTPNVTYTYDTASVANSKGRLASVSSSVSTYNYLAYDALGRVTSCKQTTDENPYTMSYDYNLAGGLVSQVYPSGRTVVTEYDNAARISGVKNPVSGNYYAGAAPADTTNRMKYNAFGSLSEMRFGNNLWQHINFNSMRQATQIGLGTSSSNSSVLQLDYNYGSNNNNGNIQSQVITLPGDLILTQTYTYDAVNRLQSALEMKGSTESWKQTYSYTDPNGQHGRFGNRRIDSSNTTPAFVGENPLFDPASNRIQAQAGEQYLYDAAGNLTRSRTGIQYVYDGDGRMSTYNGGNPAAGGATYAYDGDGRRVKKISPSGTNVFVYNAMGQLVAEYSTTPPVPRGTSYITTDHLGSPRVITRAGAVVAGRHDYLPFGEEIPEDFGDRDTVDGYEPTNEDLKQKFTGKERDVESGLDYFGARYYGAVQGRFTSADPLLSSGKPQNPQSWNRYAYTLNRPTVSTDPLGLFVWGDISPEQKEKFRAALNAARADLIKVGQKYGTDSKQYTEAKRALDIYGDEGKDNGVTVSVGEMHPENKGANAETSVSNKVGPKNKALNPNGQRINIKFSEKGINSDVLEETVVHEGSHAADGSEWVAGGFKNSPSRYQTEFRAFMAEGAISEVAHPNNTVGGWLQGVTIPGKNPYLPERNYLWNPSWEKADIERLRTANVNSMLAHPKAGGGYGLTPTNNGGPAFKK